MEALKEKLRNVRKGGIKYRLKGNKFVRNNQCKFYPRYDSRFTLEWIIEPTDVGEDLEFVYKFIFRIKFKNKIVDNTIHGIGAVDLYNNIEKYENHFVHILEKTNQLLLGKEVKQVLSELDRVKDINKNYVELMDEYRGEIRSLTHKIYHQDEEIIWLRQKLKEQKSLQNQ